MSEVSGKTSNARVALKQTIIGCAAVSVVYVYFLIFAQFAFLQLLQSAKLSFEGFANPGLATLDVVMGTMGFFGIAASIFTAVLLAKRNFSKVISVGLLLAACSALAAPFAMDLFSFIAVAAGIGCSVAICTVALATGLSQMMGGVAVALKAGVGTGIGYFVCNIPAVFNASSSEQSFFAAFLTASLAVLLLTAPEPGPESQNDLPTLFENRRLKHALAIATLVFLALVWLDSAAFYVIQEVQQLKAETWSGNARLWLNATVHLVAAIFAGVLLQRGMFWLVVILAFLSLFAGVTLLQWLVGGAAYASTFYVAGVSLYSTALVVFPSYRLSQKALLDNGKVVATRWRAALLYAVGGWFGSAMGIGMAKDLERVPLEFLLISAVLIIGLCLYSKKQVAVYGALLAIFVLNQATDVLAEDSPEARGRAVYIAEGCIHCHSQFVRPIDLDIERWGPKQSIEAAQQGAPPLIGNRRLGPDLSNIGLRRNAQWQELHLRYPQRISPGSMMPSYNHLFSSGTKGADLLAYLQSLGTEEADAISARLSYIHSWQPSVNNTESFEREAASRLFKKSCAQCHGEQGNGSGKAAELLSVLPADLVSGPFIYTAGLNAEDRLLKIARVIKFGIFQKPMPGHEYFTDAAVMALARYVYSLRNQSYEQGEE